MMYVTSDENGDCNLSGFEGTDTFLCPDVRDSVIEYLSKQEEVSLPQINSWLRTPPKLTVVRINTYKCSKLEAQKRIEEHLEKANQTYIMKSLPKLDEVLILEKSREFHCQIVPEENEVVVDEACGLAVLRGADVFAPGILSMSPGVPIMSRVSVWSDLDKKCLRGSTGKYKGRKILVGNGVLRVTRDQVFRENVRGVGVFIDQRIFSCPSLDDTKFDGELMLQNLPSVLAVDYLDPQPRERILDMCAAPGGKTMHIASRLKNTGEIFALDKSTSKIGKIMVNAKNQGFTNIKAFAVDSVKTIKEEEGGSAAMLSDSSQSKNEFEEFYALPPFPRESFDRVLLDAPCSALGQRPQFFNKMKMKELRSFPRLQRNLFRTAVSHVKKGGVLVYSTCTLAWDENEGLAEWALQTFPCLRPCIIGDEGKNYRTFGHPLNEDLAEDCIAFFVSKFVKT